MKWVNNWFARKCREAWNDDRPYVTPTKEIDDRICADGMNIKIWGATGGHIVEFRKYDIHKERNDNRMYIISADQNFSESLTKIISLEMYR